MNSKCVRVTQETYARIHLWEWSFISGWEVGAIKSLKRGPKYVSLPLNLGPKKKRQIDIV